MRKNVASQVICAQLVSKTDGSDVTTGTTTVYVTGDGGAQGAGSGTVVHEGNGTWSYVPTQAETNYTHIAFTFVNTNAVSAVVNVYTVGQDFTAAQLVANTTQLAGQTVSAAAGVTFPSSVASPTNITAATGITVATNNDKTGYALSSAGVQAIWDALVSALTTVGSIGKRLVDYLTGDTYARLGAPAGASVSADIAGIKAKTDNLPASPAAVGSPMTLTGDYDAAKTAAQAGDAMTLSNDAVSAAALAADALAEIKAQVEAVLASTARAELAAVPAANASLADKLTWITMILRNKRTQTNTTETVYADDGATPVATSTKADDGTTYTRSEYV